MWRRLLILFCAMLCLGAGLWGGINRIGWEIWAGAYLPLQHGPLMVSGFLGTLIGLERAVALGGGWTLAVPALTGLGAIVFHSGFYGPGCLMVTAGSAGLLGLSLLGFRRQASWAVALMTAGAMSWLIGNLLWLLLNPIPRSVPFWAAFVILAIVGERLELNRFILHPAQKLRPLWIGLILFSFGLVASLFWVWGVRLLGLGMMVFSLWLLSNDVARIGLSQESPSSRFRAISLLIGFLWLGLAGLQWVLFGYVPNGPRYDAALHSIFLGFTLSMFFAHALIIFPNLLKRPFHFGKRLYFPLVLLHLSVLLRVGSDLAGWWRDREYGEMLSGVFLDGQKFGGLFNALSILLFMGCVISLRDRRDVN
jgi:hypothetical protein